MTEFQADTRVENEENLSSAPNNYHDLAEVKLGRGPSVDEVRERQYEQLAQKNDLDSYEAYIALVAHGY